MTAKSFDEFLILLGTRKWNLFLFTGISLCGFMVPAIVFAGVYLTPAIEFRCVTPKIANLSEVTECSFILNTNTSSNISLQTKHKCTQWEFSTDIFATSLTAEFELVCERAYLRPTYQTVYMIGNLISAPLTGFLSDRFGRKKICAFGSVLGVSSVLVSSYLTSVKALLIFRFFSGFSQSPMLQSGYILCMEACEPKMRSLVGMLLALPWAFGTMWYGAIGYVIDDWRWLTRATLIPGLLFIVGFLWLIDESPRWLIVSGEHYEALKVLKKAARWNKVLLPPDDEILVKMEEIQKSTISKVAKNPQTVNTSKSWKMRWKHFMNYFYVLFKTPELRRITLLMFMAYFVAATVFYGLSLNAVNFKLDPYTYMVIGGLMEIPAYTVTIPIIAKLGRIPPTIISYIISGITIIALAFISTETIWLVYSLAMTARLCISAAYQIIYLIASEAFPTEVRLQAMGTSSFVSRIGAILAPFITDSLGPLYPWMPSIILGSVSIFAGVATYFIPETNNKNLVETIAQLEEDAKLPRKRNVEMDGTIEEKSTVI